MVGAMGKINDTNAVTDSRARVYGVSNLRVVDTSAFPFLPPGHPQAVVCKSRLSCPTLEITGWKAFVSKPSA